MPCRLLPLGLLLLCSSTYCSLGCDLNQGIQKDISLLKQIHTFSLWPCLKDRTNFSFPRKAMESSQFQGGNVTVMLHEMLQQIFTLFSLNTAPAAWDQTQLTKLLLGLDQQMEILERCLGQEAEWQEPSLVCDHNMLALKSYFQGISQYLQAKRYSLCAWEIVWIEIRRLFLFINELTRNHRN
ncbi:interferon alpha-3-like [Dromiciops gliroides]|uniref:interferon alpha-3-like n=1 Tax=Dromiciops gliroides TaxID=33562 RepID=UPI001CC340F8|nr:interferon alpha-3-like [Dromiciops gliroides]